MNGTSFVGGVQRREDGFQFALFNPNENILVQSRCFPVSYSKIDDYEMFMGLEYENIHFVEEDGIFFASIESTPVRCALDEFDGTEELRDLMIMFSSTLKLEEQLRERDATIIDLRDQLKLRDDELKALRCGVAFVPEPKITDDLPSVTVTMIGLDGSGKTSILYRLHLGEVVTTIPTIGFNVETLVKHGVKFTVWDVGGQPKIRTLWQHYYFEREGLIFVVDSNDRERIEEAREELWKAVPETFGVPLLVFVNKMDYPNAKSVREVADKLNLADLPTGRQWYVQGCCANTGEGLSEGFEWLARVLT